MFGGNGASTHFFAVQPTSVSSASSRRTSGENMMMVSASSKAGMIGDPAQPVQPAPFVLNQDNLAPPQPRDGHRQQRRERSPASRPRSESCRPRSAPSRPRARYRRSILPTASGLMSWNCRDRSFRPLHRSRRVNWPTPHCICGPAPRNSARYRGSDVIVPRRSFLEISALAIHPRH